MQGTLICVMHPVFILSVLLPHMASVLAGSLSCQDVLEDRYSVITCGAPGANGQPGLNGINGQKGQKGDAGLTGAPGLPGVRGSQGTPGVSGNKGDVGFPGAPGPVGPAGNPGSPGQNGAKGDSTLALDAVKAQLNTLYQQVQDLQSILEQQGKALGLFRKTVISGGKRYTSTGAEANYNEALSICSNAGGRLATPRDSSENDVILSIRNYYNGNVYLGINSLLSQGVFRYLNGDTISYTNWSPAEPNNLASELCVEMYNTGKWNNKKCERTSLVICEI